MPAGQGNGRVMPHAGAYVPTSQIIHADVDRALHEGAK